MLDMYVSNNMLIVGTSRTSSGGNSSLIRIKITGIIYLSLSLSFHTKDLPN